jgi:transcriptional regulator with AAA-type ATPase domain/tetratricopeptide (TPR) repeat protein
MADLRRQIERLATFDTPGNPHVPTVLLQGETGTGKGLAARVIHGAGGRSAGPFVDVNCAAIPETMLEAELFGFEAGAFTDARRAKPGLFEAAAGGSLFLDEVDALPLVLQSKLLKAIEEKRVRRLGAVAQQQVDVKLIAATQKDLRQLVGDGRFRADLYHRLAVVVLEIPPLRRRGSDVVTLAESFLASHGAAHGVAARRLTAPAREWLGTYTWPGNVRELSHLMERVTLLVPEVEVDRETLERLRVPVASAPAVEQPQADDGEPARIRDALGRTGGNVVRAARLLGMGRNALRHRMRRYGIDRPSLDAVAPDESGETPPETSATAPRESRWEQRPVAVLAVELVVPDDALEPWTTVRRWETKITEVIAGFEGAVLAKSPGRIAAVFGLPRALEQLPRRAVLAALAIRRLVGDGAPHDDVRPEVRMAVHAGAVRADTAAAEVVAGLLPVGDTVALADRLLGHAGRGDILLSPAVSYRVEAWCTLQPRALRMGDATLGVHAVLGQRPGSAGTAASGATRFVGRGGELDLLRGSFESAVAGQGQVVFVVGEAGMGKSRLLAEFRRQLADVPHTWIEGGCASYGTSTAFHPIIDGLRRFWGLDDQDDEAAARAKVEAGVAALGEDLAWTLPFVRHVLGLATGDARAEALDSASRRSETFRALKALTLRAAEQRPLVVVVEDLHWIDPASEEYLAFIADVVPTTRALLVCSYRPGYRHPFGDRSYHVRVTLRPLAPADMAAITEALLGALAVPAEVDALIAEKAEGNPFFVEEVTRALLEDGTLRRDDGRIVLARDAPAIAVPDSIQDVLVARLDRLQDDARRAIQVASVIGREFAIRLLERITEAGERVRTHVEELRSLELIYEKAAHPELAYMFKHALTHDVAYASVLHDRRIALHRTIGLAIEELYADRLAEFYETLAHHFERAEEWERALDYHQRAAGKAAESFANRAVIVHCRQALDIADRLGDAVPGERRRALEEQLALASFYVSEFEASGEAYGRAAEHSSDPGARGVALGLSGFSFFWGHRYARADAATDAALDLARQHDARVAEALALSNGAFFRAVCQGDVAGQVAVLERAAALAAGVGDEAIHALIRFNLAQCAEWSGDYAASIAISEDVIAAGRRLRLAHLVVWPGWFLGKAYCCLGQYGRALAQLTEAANVCERIGDRVWKSRLLNTIGWCLAEVGSHPQAREYNLRAAALAHEVGDPEILGNSEINLAINELAMRGVGAALEHLGPIVDGLAASDDPWMRWRYGLHARHLEGEVALRQGEPARALGLAHAEADGAARHRAPRLQARALLLAGDAHLAMDERDAAEGALTEALRIAERIAHPRGAWLALERLAALARQGGRPGDAAQHETRRRILLEGAASTLEDGTLRRGLTDAA